MQDVFGASCEPRPARPPRRFGAHWLSYVVPTLWATVFAALILHLLAQLAARVDPADPATILSVLVGAAGVLVTLMPFAVLFALRARRAWLAALPPDERPTGPAVAPRAR